MLPPLPPGAVAVIFESRRNGVDPDGYAAAAATMDAHAARQPGFLGVSPARDPDGFGVTVSYWRDEAAAIAWREDAEHATVRAIGRERWYAAYRVIVATVSRSYGWTAEPGAAASTNAPPGPAA